MSVGRLGLNPRPFASLPNTATHSAYAAANVQTATSAAYGAWVELVAAASNTSDKYVFSVSANFSGNAATVGPIYVRLGIGAAGAETAISTDINAANVHTANGTGSMYFHGEIGLTPALHISAGTRIAVSVRHYAGTGSIHTCTVTCNYALRTAIAP